MKTSEILGSLRRGIPMLGMTALLAAGLLSGCGQKGPLYLPAPAEADGPASKARTTEPLDPTVVEPGMTELAPITQP